MLLQISTNWASIASEGLFANDLKACRWLIFRTREQTLRFKKNNKDFQRTSLSQRHTCDNCISNLEDPRKHSRLNPKSASHFPSTSIQSKLHHTMSEESRRTMTQSRRRPRNNEILYERSRTTNSILRSTTTTRAKEFFFILALLASCWTIQLTEAVSLLDGRYETTTDVTDYLNLALDVSKMSESDDIDVKLDIYKNVSWSLFVTRTIGRSNCRSRIYSIRLSHGFIFCFQFYFFQTKGCATSDAQLGDTAKLISLCRRENEK